MDTFDHLLNWTLKRGSHPFPGPDGGTCINEAALVAAGDEDRQPLLPFVTRLACADTPEIEATSAALKAKRADYIRCHTRGHPYGIPMDLGLGVLEGALAIGWQADPFPAEEVKTRMDIVRTQMRMPTPVSDTPLFTRIKKWLIAKETA